MYTWFIRYIRFLHCGIKQIANEIDGEKKAHISIWPTKNRAQYSQNARSISNEYVASLRVCACVVACAHTIDYLRIIHCFKHLKIHSMVSQCLQLISSLCFFSLLFTLRAFFFLFGWFIRQRQQRRRLLLLFAWHRYSRYMRGARSFMGQNQRRQSDNNNWR